MSIITDTYDDGSYWVSLKYGSGFGYLEDFGYIIPKVRTKWGKMQAPKGTIIMVRLEHLKRKSAVRVTKVCDYCGEKILNQTYANIISSRDKTDGTDRCFDCGKDYGATKYRENAPFDKSLQCKYPDVSIRWITEMNSGLTPDRIYAFSDTVYWWNCDCCKSIYEMPVKEKTINRNGCPYCSGKRVNNTNCLWNTNPDVAEMLWNVDDGFKYTKGSHDKIDFKCLECGGKVQSKNIYNIVRTMSVYCDRCSDGYSYPERFVRELLNQLHIEYKFQTSFCWSKTGGKYKKGKIYDFYIDSHNMIIETHGKQHYERPIHKDGRSVKEERINDQLKRNLALDNGIINYIEIDCRESNLEYIRREVLSSELTSCFDFTHVDWMQCHQTACKSLLINACSLWNDSPTKSTKDIALKLKVHQGTIISYLKQGKALGICDYEPKKQISEAAKARGKEIVQLSPQGDYIREIKSILEAAKFFNKSPSNIHGALKSSNKKAYGYKWLYKSIYSELS